MAVSGVIRVSSTTLSHYHDTISHVVNPLGVIVYLVRALVLQTRAGADISSIKFLLLLFGSDRSSVSGNLCLSVPSAESCLDHSIFIFLTQILHDDFWKTSGRLQEEIHIFVCLMKSVLELTIFIFLAQIMH